MNDFVDLDRRFADIDLGEDQEALAERSYLHGLDGVDQGVSWESLLESRLVVVLGEPGSGKTRELKHQAERIRLAGGRAYFLPLERLVKDDVAAILKGQPQADDFAAWQKGDSTACFFLDAVDESKLQRTDDFLTALERLYASVKSRLSRCRFVISSRISAWRPATDREEVLRRYGMPRTTAQEGSAGSSDEEPLRIVTLLPLDRSRVERFAKQLGVRDPEKFVEAIDDNEAWDFARRPLDVVDLHKYWKVHGRLNGLTQLLEFSVTMLLAEVENKAEQDLVSPAEAREGAELLAAATVLCRQVSFVIEDGRAINAPVALSPQQVLPPSWRAVKVRALLDRAIFDSASYGCLRFHHRRHAEYLAAMWLERLMAANCPLEALEEVLFATIDGQPTLRPSLEPVAAWLVKGTNEPWRQRLARHLLASAPDIHLRWGDPAALPLAYRRDLLAAIVRHFSGRSLVRVSWNRDALARLATPELADDINGYLRDRAVAEDLKTDFLMLVCCGKLSACVPAALELLADQGASDSLKTYAATVVRDVGTREHRQQAATVFELLKKPSDTLIVRFYEVLFPQIMCVADLLASLPGCGEVRRETVDLPHGLPELLASGLTPETAGEMLRGLLAYLKEPPLIDRASISQRNVWLLGSVPACLHKLLSSEVLAADSLGVASEALSLLEKCERDGLWEGFYRETEKALIVDECARHAALRRGLFWERVAEHRTEYEYEPFVQVINHGAIVPVSIVDLSWLLTDLVGARALPDRRLALEMAFMLIDAKAEWLRTGLFWRLLRSVSASRPLLVCLGRLMGDKLLLPLRRVWHKKRYLGDRWWWRRKWYSVADWRRKMNDHWWCWRHLAELRRGEHPQSLAIFARLAGGSFVAQYSPRKWSAVEAEWGKRVADAARSGCEAAWREFSPHLPHEKDERNEVDSRVVMGLAGLQSLWQRGALDFSALADKEVATATRYACSELNGFPLWFEELLAARPVEVAVVVAQAIAGEWQFPADMPHVHEVVAKIARCDAELGRLVPLVVDQLKSGDPVHPRMLDCAFSLFIKYPQRCSADLAALAPLRTPTYSSGSYQWFSWIDLWLQIDALPALAHLERTLAIFPPVEADELVVNLCARMSRRGEESPSLAQPSYRTPSGLLALLPLVVLHVRRSEDIDRGGRGVFTPGVRDDAQHFRSGLWESLAGNKGPRVDEVFRSLLKMPALAGDGDWILHLLERRRALRADDEPWAASAIRTFAEQYLVAPRSDYTLFRLVCRQLSDFRDEIEFSESAGNRLQLRSGDLEHDFRGLLFSALNESGRGCFSVTQESEVDLAQRPDLTVKSPGLNSLPIEIKLANLRHWTLPKLIERLENQLLGQYLRPASIRYGIYVLGNTDPQRQWKEPDSGRLIGFDELVRRVVARAAALQTELPEEVDALKVIAIDFSDPRKRGRSVTEAAAAS